MIALIRDANHPERELSIPFIIAPLYQEFDVHTSTYKQFITDLESYDCVDIMVENSEDEWNGVCKIEVFFYKENKNYNVSEEANFRYEIEVDLDNRYYGYCNCTKNDYGYREDKGCCGYNCDWDAPAFEMRKNMLVGNKVWVGTQHDYWDFEDEFYKRSKEEKEKELEERRNKIDKLERSIKEIQKWINQLENM